MSEGDLEGRMSEGDLPMMEERLWRKGLEERLAGKTCRRGADSPGKTEPGKTRKD